MIGKLEFNFRAAKTLNQVEILNDSFIAVFLMLHPQNLSFLQKSMALGSSWKCILASSIIFSVELLLGFFLMYSDALAYCSLLMLHPQN